jgi:hypothetical protein
MKDRPRIRKHIRNAAIYTAIIVGTLVIVDLLLMMLNILPPTYSRGHAEFGWVSGMPTGRFETVRCLENASQVEMSYVRNEDGVRTSSPSSQLRTDTSVYGIAVGGDSQTDLCAANAETHFGVMEQSLRQVGIPAVAFAYGAGKYSPLQAYLAANKWIGEYHADAFVLNLYTGNDVYDMLRVDDRPHFVRTDTGYRIEKPIWYQEYPPDERYRSRVLFLLRTLARKTGVRNVAVRIRYLRQVAREQDQGIGVVMRYMNDLRKSRSNRVGYPAAFSAQMLNQQLFFHHFPGSMQECLQRVRALLRLVRAEHPSLLLVLTPIPSYQLLDKAPVDPRLSEVTARLPMSYAEGVAMERSLYDSLRVMASDEGWLFVDAVAALREYKGSEPLFNDFDFHLLPPASALIGSAQASVIAQAARATPAAATGRPLRRP